MPNSNSFIGRRFGAFLTPYANSIGINQPWTFFSPDPSLIYTVNYRINATESITGKFPSTDGNFLLDTRKLKEFYQVRFMMKDMSLYERLLAPWFCKEHPEASSVSFRIDMKAPPSLDKAVLLSAEDMRFSFEERTIFNQSYPCGNEEDASE